MGAHPLGSGMFEQFSNWPPAFVLISAKSQSSDHIRPSLAPGPWLVLRVRYEAFTL